MPVTISGPLQIHNITTNAIVKFGDSSVLSPKDLSKVFIGSGAVNTAFGVMTNTAVNSTNLIEPDVIDQPIVRNN